MLLTVGPAFQPLFLRQFMSLYSELFLAILGCESDIPESVLWQGGQFNCIYYGIPLGEERVNFKLTPSDRRSPLRGAKAGT